MIKEIFISTITSNPNHNNGWGLFIKAVYYLCKKYDTKHMSIQEQLDIKTYYHNEAIRYMNNAKDNLLKAGKDGKHYKDDKYVKSACGIAYSGVLKALDGYLILKGVEKKKGRKSIESYVSNIAKLDKKLNADLNAAYEVLHLSGYYDGLTYVPVILNGFEVAYDIIKRIEP